MTTPDDFAADYTLAEVAAILRKDPRTVGDMARADKLPGAYQLTERGRWSVRRYEFDAWHASLGRKRQPNPDPHGLEAPSSRSAARRKNRAA